MPGMFACNLRSGSIEWKRAVQLEKVAMSDLEIMFIKNLELLRVFMVRFGRAPSDLINSIKADVERSPSQVGHWFYSVLLAEYPELCELFIDETDGGDSAEMGPKELTIKPVELRHQPETEYHR